MEAGRHFADVVGVAHPADIIFIDTFEEQALRILDFALAVFTRFRMGDPAAQFVRDELATVADAEHGDTQFKNFRIHVGRARLVHAVRSAREDDADGRVFADFIDACREWHKVAVHALLAHAARDQLVVLSAEIQNQNSLMLHFN